MHHVLHLASQLHDEGFPLDGQMVFSVTEDALYSMGQHNMPLTAGEPFQVRLDSASPAAEAARTTGPVYLASPDEYAARFPATYQLAVRAGHEAWASLPLTVRGELVGVWLAAFSEPVAFTSDEQDLLTLTAELLTAAVEDMQATAAEHTLSQRLRHSMDQSVAPRGMTVAARYLPTGGGLLVGGDWYDCIRLHNGHLALVIGDVEGSDVHAAGVMSQLRTAVHAYALEGHGPDSVLTRASRFLSSQNSERFATCLYVEADPDSGELHLARAGHPHPVLRLPDGTCLLKHIPGGLPLGLMSEADDYPVTTLALAPDEILMLCTDGLIESGGHDMYTGWVRLRDVLSPAPAGDLEGMAERLLRVVTDSLPAHTGRRRETRADDMALLLVRRDPADHTKQPTLRHLALTITQERADEVAMARQEISGLLHDWTDRDQVDSAALLTTELIGNVMVHTDAPASIHAALTSHHRLYVEVTDGGDYMPHQLTPSELAPGGRGLMLLDALAAQWGVRPEAVGKTVWFVMCDTENVTS
ncbi:serine/threonine-protein phosphatase [Streptomyces reniochalinae]|uniref:protein-serine/threonine phosphatase n=2 Tax=Streptomyces reniochalinae TaxID=2250578 RepID=A0A367EIC9_9ACTN|nr:serine/threonine-protein phosphatase [Streptomyces reniochalinae]